MHQAPSGTFATVIPQPSRVAHLAAEYARWYAVYVQAGDADAKLDADVEPQIKDDLHIAEGQAVRRMKELIDELTATPARSLHDFGFKARVLRVHQGPDWYDVDAKLSRGEILARTMMVELMEISGLPPIKRRDFEPKELLPSFEEPPALPLAPSPFLSPTCLPVECLAAELGRRFGDAARTHNLIDGKDQERVECCEALNQMFDSYKEAIAFVEARSAEGALAQVCAAAGSATVLYEITKDDHETEASKALRSINACLWSVRSFIEGHFHVDAKAVGSEYWMSERLRFSSRVAKLEAQLRAPAQPFREAAE